MNDARLPIGHPARHPDRTKVAEIVADGDLSAAILDYIAFYHPIAFDASRDRIAKVREAMK